MRSRYLQASFDIIIGVVSAAVTAWLDNLWDLKMSTYTSPYHFSKSLSCIVIFVYLLGALVAWMTTNYFEPAAFSAKAKVWAHSKSLLFFILGLSFGSSIFLRMRG
jgi:hypothetical protein